MEKLEAMGTSGDLVRASQLKKALVHECRTQAAGGSGNHRQRVVTSEKARASAGGHEP